MPRLHMETFTGKMVDPVNIKLEDVDLRDIARGLSRMNRYAGQIKLEQYSVAEHSWRVWYAVRELGGSYRQQQIALLHDASEAYVADIVRPVKGRIQGYAEIEDTVMRAVFQRFGLNPETAMRECELPGLVKRVDHNIIRNERPAVKVMYGQNNNYWFEDDRTFVPEPPDPYGWAPNVAEEMFLDKAKELGLG